MDGRRRLEGRLEKAERAEGGRAVFAEDGGRVNRVPLSTADRLTLSVLGTAVALLLWLAWLLDGRLP